MDPNYTGNDVCPVGYYCPNGTAYPLPCPIGTFSIVDGLGKVEECQPCPEGYYCNVTAFTDPTNAPECDPG